MCGIAALLLHPQERAPQTWQEMGEIFTRSLIFNEARGNAATGLAMIDSDGHFQILKRPLPASEFTRLPEYRQMLEQLSSTTTLLLGHTRLPTKGSPANNDNNHPIIAGHVLGVHNGQIENDDELFRRFHYPRQAQVDSEIIFRLLDAVSPQLLNGQYLNAACKRLHLLQGQFTFLSSDLRMPRRLMVLKHHNPLCLHYHEEWNTLVFSSRYIFLRKAFGRAVITEALPHDQVMIFDADTLPRLGNQPQSTCRFSAAQ